MDKLVNELTIERRARICWTIFTILLPLFGYPQNSSEIVNTPHKNVQAFNSQKRLVTWTYLRAMTTHNQNPTIVQFLKKQNQLVSKETDLAVFTGKCNPYNNNCGEEEYDDGAKSAAWRVDIPVYLDNQPVFISFVIIYAKDTYAPIAQGVQIYGTKALTSSSYSQPVASYDKSTNELSIIGNLANRALTTVNNRPLKIEAGGSGSLRSRIINVALNPNSSPPSTIYESTIIYLNFKVNLAHFTGAGVVQFNGTQGPVFHYLITPF